MATGSDVTVQVANLLASKLEALKLDGHLSSQLNYLAGDQRARYMYIA